MEENIPEPIHNETIYQNEAATEASNGWLEKAGDKAKRWLGHTWRFLGTDTMIGVGTGFATLGILGSIITGNPLPLLLTAGGGTLAGGGVMAQWDIGMKHAESGTEKGIFKAAKVAETVGTSALTVLGALSNPAYLPVATGMHLAGTVMGARSMAHRP